MKRLFIKSILGIVVTSCCLSQSAFAQYDYDEEELYANPQLSFRYVTDKIFRPRCYKCHSDAGGNKEGVNLETYANVYALRFKIRKMAIVRKAMPPRRAGGPLNARELEILDRWLRAGAPLGAPAEIQDYEAMNLEEIY